MSRLEETSQAGGREEAGFAEQVQIPSDMHPIVAMRVYSTEHLIDSVGETLKRLPGNAKWISGLSEKLEMLKADLHDAFMASDLARTRRAFIDIEATFSTFETFSVAFSTIYKILGGSNGVGHVGDSVRLLLMHVESGIGELEGGELKNPT
jgi:hypothetical protein